MLRECVVVSVSAKAEDRHLKAIGGQAGDKGEPRTPVEMLAERKIVTTQESSRRDSTVKTKNE